MKLFHISDLHIGKQLNLYDLSEVQRDVLTQIVQAAERERPDAIVIAGDIYDRSAPSGEAFALFDAFLNNLGTIKPMIPVLIISGNHDSNLRLNFASSFLAKHQIYISSAPPQNGEEHLKKIILNDEYGSVNFYMFPFVKPADAKNLLGDGVEIRTYDDAFAAILAREEIDFTERNVLIAHQFFVSGGNEPERRESELRYISVGGIDSVDVCHIRQFDYAALGHLHAAQQTGSPHIRYSGTPLKYSAGEASDRKAVTVATLGEKGTEPQISFLPLVMKPDVRKLRGTLVEVLAVAKEYGEDYVSITLTDEETLFRPKERLREFYRNMIDIHIENTRTAALLKNDVSGPGDEEPLALFSDFYREMNGQPIGEAELAVMADVIEKVGERGAYCG